MEVGHKIEIKDPYEIFPADQGMLFQYFGLPRAGKTYIATADAIDDLKDGKVVYTSWIINWEGYDERKQLIKKIWGILGLKKNYINIPKENWHYLPYDEKFHDTFRKLTDCVVYLDEGHIVFDSYQLTKMKLAERVAVLATGHFDRTIKIISQRPTAIHVSLRGNVNVFYECKTIFKIWRIIIFVRREYYEMLSETVDLEKPAGWKLYIGRKKIFKMFDSKFMRGNAPTSQENKIEIYKLTFKERLLNLIKRSRN